MLDRLENGYERLLQFSADLAHELRTPIGTLIGETQVTLAHERSVAEEDGARIVVRNRGPRVEQEKLGRLFDRFYRSDAARSEFTESSGLGLSIVQAIMRLHGGSASAACTQDGWIEFTLWFPRDSSIASSDAATAKAPA
ncbi:Heavy metal sensor histidine kinase [Candidatus Burkholderia brachyanthoides]|nr:Heavy metal sensor histidine kinase [Candidatus Burkholderia brachyanthoides]